MRIVVNAALLPDIYSQEYLSFLSETFERITKKHRDHSFIFICESQHADLFVFEGNVEVVKTKQGKRNAIIWKYWYDVRIPALLRKYKADLFFSPGMFCSLATKLPQCMMITDHDFLHFPSFFTKSQLFFLKKHGIKSVAKAKRIITFTNYTKEELAKNYKDAESKIDTLSTAVYEGFETQPDIIREQAKAKYTGGKEFFLYNGILHSSGNLINLLKAFSLFKKRQQSSFKLIICSGGINNYKLFTQLLETYKYKADISLIDKINRDELSGLILSAYAFVYPVLFNGLSMPVIRAMQADIPVIVSDKPAIKEIIADAALYVNPENPRDIADSMMRIYKDEKLRNELIEKGKTIVNRLKQHDTADQVWQALLKALL